MRISFVIYRPSISGGARVIADYAAYLLRQGHDVRIFAQPTNPRSRHKRLFGRSSGRSPEKSRGKSFYDVMGERLIFLPQLGPPRPEDLPDADIVVACFWVTAEWVAALPPSKGKKAYFMQDYGAAAQPLEKVQKTWTLGLHTITISSDLQREVQEISHKPVVVVPNGVSKQFLRNQPRSFRKQAPTVGFVYSNNAQKGSRYCIEAIELARRKLPELRGVAFGARPPPENLSLPSFIDLRLRLSDSEVMGVYSACDAWLFGSLREGFGLPILEAMASGTPVIGARSAAAPDILAHGGGYLVDVAAAGQMAERIVEVCSLPEPDWLGLSNEARTVAARFSIDEARRAFEVALLDLHTSEYERPQVRSGELG
jgi:glycosyltransferase involved in cell wall biosynthesis